MYKANAEAIQKARIEKGYNVSKVSKKTKISRWTIMRLESGTVKRPQISTLKKLATYYGKNILDFMEVIKDNG